MFFLIKSPSSIDTVLTPLLELFKYAVSKSFVGNAVAVVSKVASSTAVLVIEPFEPLFGE